MQNSEITERTLQLEKAVKIQYLMVKLDRTEEESIHLSQLLAEQQQLCKIKTPEINNDDFTNCIFERNVEPQDSSSESEEPPVRKPKVPTIAAVVHKHANDGTVHIKRVMNKAYKGNLGSQQTPVKALTDVTNSVCTLSPGFSTGFFEQTVRVEFRKASGGKFLEVTSSSSEESTNSEESGSENSLTC